MKRGGPLKRKTPLRAGRSAPREYSSGDPYYYQRKAPKKARPKKRSKYASRKRAPESWWRFVKAQACAVAVACEMARTAIDATMFACFEAEVIPLILTPCGGVIEADHEGAHGLSRKSKDRDVAAICTQHHRERTDHTGAFKQFKRADMRTFNAWAIERTHRLAKLAGVEIPTC